MPIVLFRHHRIRFPRLRLRGVLAPQLRALWCAATCLVLLLPPGALASEVNDGLAAYRAGKHAKALRILQPLAKDGDAQAQYLLGVMRERGQGVPRDATRAARWYERAIETGGYPPAYWRLGLLYRDGRGVKQDPARARELLSEGARLGSRQAKSALAQMPGAAVSSAKTPITAAAKLPAVAPREPAASFSISSEAALAEQLPQEMLARVAEHRQVIARDAKNEAARQGLADQAVAAAELLLAAEAVENAVLVRTLREFTLAEFSETAWRLGQMAKRDDARAHAALGLWREQGLVVSRDSVLGCDHYVQAAKTGHAAAQYHSALCLAGSASEEARTWLMAAGHSGHAGAQELLARGCIEGNPRDFDCARRWLEPAAEAGRPSAMVLLGWVASASGDGGERAQAHALRWYARAANRGHAVAQNNLGECYERGKGVEADAAKAALWYGKAAAAGLPAAQYNLGRMLLAGAGVPRDEANAKTWLRRAAEAGVAQAQALLARAP